MRGGKTQAMLEELMMRGGGEVVCLPSHAVMVAEKAEELQCTVLCRLTIKPPDPEREALRLLLEESGPVVGRKEVPR